VALLLSGTLGSKYKPQTLIPRVLPALRSHVVGPLVASHAKSTVDIFVCVSNLTTSEAANARKAANASSAAETFFDAHGQPDWLSLRRSGNGRGRARGGSAGGGSDAGSTNEHLRGRTGLMIIPEGDFATFDASHRSDHSWNQYVRLESCFVAAVAYEQRDVTAVPGQHPTQRVLGGRRNASTGMRQDAVHAPAIDGSSKHVRRERQGQPPALVALALHWQGHTAFTHFIRMRPDLFWEGAVPLESFQAFHVAVRAQSVIFMDECQTIHHDALELPIGCRGRQGGVSPRVNPQDDARRVLETRKRMRTAGIPICVCCHCLKTRLPHKLTPPNSLRCPFRPPNPSPPAMAHT
jgi:hypothetical protein